MFTIRRELLRCQRGFPSTLHSEHCHHVGAMERRTPPYAKSLWTFSVTTISTIQLSKFRYWLSIYASPHEHTRMDVLQRGKLCCEIGGNRVYEIRPVMMLTFRKNYAGGFKLPPRSFPFTSIKCGGIVSGIVEFSAKSCMFEPQFPSNYS